MKKLLYSSLILLLFSVSLLITQISCQKEVNAQNNGTNNTNTGNNNNTTTTQLNIILYSTIDYHNNDQVTLWTVNLDGSNKKQVPVPVPPGWNINTDAQLSKDAKSIVFSIYKNGTAKLCSCNIDGTNFKTIVDNSTLTDIGMDANSWE